jgi:glycosyltransferase involved in cell wall biosynthesis
MDISVIVPFHDEKRYIERCVKALISQRYEREKYEVIFIDNNSNDGSAEVVQKFKDVILLYEKKPGAYAARNRGINRSKGKILAFTDSDCVPHENWLKNISNAFNDPKIKLVQGTVKFAEKGKALSLLEDYDNEKAAYVYSSDKKEAYYGYTNNMAVRREMFEDFGNFIEIMRGGDTIFLQKVLEKYSCASAIHSPDIRVLHLEINHFYKYFNKNYTYGKSCRNLEKIYSTKPITNTDRITILKRIIKKNRYSVMDHGILFLLLFTGSAFFKLGQIKENFG